MRQIPPPVTFYTRTCTAGSVVPWLRTFITYGVSGRADVVTKSQALPTAPQSAAALSGKAHSFVHVQQYWDLPRPDRFRSDSLRRLRILG